MSDGSPSSPFYSSISSCSSPSEATSPRPPVASEDLPLPTAPRPFPTKKSHARKQPLGHIPRPRNAFILFRCDYARQNQRSVQDQDQNDVSRMVGNLWRNMNGEQRAPWVVMADAEKKRHAALYPGYKYTPRNNRKAKPTEKEVQKQIEKEAAKVVEAEAAACAAINSKDMVTVYYPPWATRRTLTYFARRATSCPPPDAVGIEPYSETVDRAMVTMNPPPRPKPKQSVAGQSPSSPTTKVFVPSDVAHDDDEAATVREDRILSQGTHAIDPPGGTASWGDVAAASSPTVYPRADEGERFQEPEQSPTAVFVSPVYGTYEGYDEDFACTSGSVPSWAINADQSLSQSSHSHSIDPPGGTSSWDEAAPAPYEYRQSTNTQYGYQQPTACFTPFYMPQQAYAPGAGSSPSAKFQNEPYYDSWWMQEIPVLRESSSPSDTSPVSSPITPTNDFTFPHSPMQSGVGPVLPSGKPASRPSTQDHDDAFLSEFGTMFPSPTTGYNIDADTIYGAGVNAFVRESSVRTTYTPHDELSPGTDNEPPV